MDAELLERVEKWAKEAPAKANGVADGLMEGLEANW